MDKFADVFICLGVMLFFLGGAALAFLGTLVSNSPFLTVTAILSLLLIGIGGYMKMKKHKEDQA